MLGVLGQAQEQSGDPIRGHAPAQGSVLADAFGKLANFTSSLSSSAAEGAAAGWAWCKQTASSNWAYASATVGNYTGDVR